MDNELEIVTNEGIEIADEVATTAAKSTQYGPIAVGVGCGLIGGALLFWGVSKLIAKARAKKAAQFEAVSEPVKDEPKTEA